MSDVYRIKPLEWKWFLDGTCYFANTPIGTLIVEQDREGGPWFFRVNGRPGSKKATSSDDGKAKAEVYYRGRLLSALDPA